MSQHDTPARPSTRFSDKYPPKNRKNTGVDSFIEVEVAWAEGSRRMDYNEVAVLGQTEKLRLGSPCAVSDLSGQPAYLYRTADVEVALTADELFRFMRHNLDPLEFFKLAEKFGLFFETHDDFYNEDTGVALQPRYNARESETFFQKCLSGDEAPEAIDQYVEQWHAKGDGTTPLHRFLGMTQLEYEAWVLDPGSLYKLLFFRLRDVGAA